MLNKAHDAYIIQMRIMDEKDDLSRDVCGLKDRYTVCFRPRIRILCSVSHKGIDCSQSYVLCTRYEIRCKLHVQVNIY